MAVIFHFVSLIVYMRLLSAADFGLFSAALALIELLGVLVTMLFHNALVQRSGCNGTAFQYGVHRHDGCQSVHGASLLCDGAADCGENAPEGGSSGSHLDGTGLPLLCCQCDVGRPATAIICVSRIGAAIANRSHGGRRHWHRGRDYGSGTLEAGASTNSDCRHRLVGALGNRGQDTSSAISLRRIQANDWLWCVFRERTSVVIVDQARIYDTGFLVARR